MCSRGRFPSVEIPRAGGAPHRSPKRGRAAQDRRRGPFPNPNRSLNRSRGRDPALQIAKKAVKTELEPWT